MKNQAPGFLLSLLLCCVCSLYADSVWSGQQAAVNVEQLPVFQQLCRPHGSVLNGAEGLPLEGVVLDKVYMLITSAVGPLHSLTLDGLPQAPVNCQFQHHAPKSSSNKVRIYHRNAMDLKHMSKSKAGLGVFEILPSTEACGTNNISPIALSAMIELGEFWADRYKNAFPQIGKPGEEAVVAGSLPEQPAFQSVSAVLHGLLSEKQFMRIGVKKLEQHKVRGLGSHSGCPSLTDIDIFLQQAYRHEHDLFKQDFGQYSASRKISLVQKSLGLGTLLPARHLFVFLSQWLCEARAIPCLQSKCLNISEVVVSHLLKISGEHNAYLSSSEIFQSYSVLDTHLYLQDLLAWLAENGSQHFIKLDVADDFFFLKFLTALGYHTQDAIIPSSRLVIEQYSMTRSAGSVRYLRLVLNGKVITQDLPACLETRAGGLCGVDAIRWHLKEKREKGLFKGCEQISDEL